LRPVPTSSRDTRTGSARPPSRTNRSFPEASHPRGNALNRLSRNDEAQEAFRREIRDFPHDPQAYASLAIVLAVGGHPKGDVDRVMDAMFHASPGPPSALLAARTLEFLGEPEAARQWRRRGGERP
jgi:hypothetical protein